MLDKTYDAAAVEPRISAAWEKAGAFKAGAGARAGAKPYSIVIPPPNVTGSLHIGHALNNTLQDILARFERMRGRDVLWQPGMDHAGIATQMVVERQMMERQESRHQLVEEHGPAEARRIFVENVWKWKAESGGLIINQLKRLGASCDWSRERFTMGEAGAPDDQMVRAVTRAFVELYNTEGPDGRRLIYKDKRLVNWDPKLQTAISDLEVQQVEHRGSFQWTRESDVPLDAMALGKVLSRDPNGHLYYVDYPIAERVGNEWHETGEVITVATTRPETMLGDIAVAVHPESDLWRRHKGKCARLPLVLNHPIYSNLIPIVPDEYADPEKGTGAVKITPAHDFNDYDVWRRHNGKGQELEDVVPISIFTPEAKLKSSQKDDLDGTKRAPWPAPPHIAQRPSRGVAQSLVAGLSVSDLIPGELRGLDRFVARGRIAEQLAVRKLLVKIEPHTHMVPHGDRSGEVIEPFLTDQWYVDAKTLAKPAIEAVRDGRTVFIPKNWERTYFDWMENIQPWCVSRQLWWGHQIPVWYGPEGETFAAPSETEANMAAAAYYESKGPHFETDFVPLNGIEYAAGLREGRYQLYRDEDVLDTWFSSALWPFSTLGWPEATPELARYYPTSVLVTGFDIIFFWVARMMMMGLHFMPTERPDAPAEKWVPFRDVYIHALVRDEKGAKMSKSKGNVIDPLALIDEYGADALRFTLAAMAAQGRDIKLSPQRVEGYRNFTTKLWNAAKFAEHYGCVRVAGFDPASARETLNRWIATETAEAAKAVTAALEAYRFNDAAAAAYRFVWNLTCDWYLELTKPVLNGEDGPAKDETRATVAYVLDEIVALLHPFMPFITEELWGQGGGRALLALSPWPAPAFEDAAAAAEINWLIDLITAIRSVRSEMNVPAAAIVPLAISGASPGTLARLKTHDAVLKRLARIETVTVTDAPLKGAVQIVAGETTVSLPLAGVVDLAAERIRLDKELRRLGQEIKRIDGKLGNAAFVAKAPKEVVEEQREKREEFVALQAKIDAALARLQASA